MYIGAPKFSLPFDEVIIGMISHGFSLYKKVFLELQSADSKERP